MAASLEANKIVGAVLTAVLIAAASGNIARMLYAPHELEEPVVRFAGEETAAASAAMAEAEGAPAGEEAAAETAAAAKGEAKGEASFVELLRSADPERGAKVAKKCAGCHSFAKGGPHKVGPNLWGIVGRPVASAEGFSYSDALRGLGGNWDYERLEAFLADPKAYAPGTKMSFAGIKKLEDRAALIAYLRTLADEPAPLP